MAYETVVIRKLKRQPAMMRWPAYIIADDDYGLWLYSAKGTIVRGQSETGVGETEVGKGNLEEGTHVMHLIPNEGWWIAMWCSERKHISVDICTPPTLMDGDWHYTDLELDPILRANGQVIVEDEDEFAEACDAGVISPDEAIHTQAASDEVVRYMRERIEPFGRAGWDKLEEAMKLSLPPVTVLKSVPLSL